MMLTEFNEATGADLTPEQYEVIERVYMYHPIFENLEEGALPAEVNTAKDFAYLLYKIGSLQIFRDLESVAYTMEVFSETVRDVDNHALREITQEAINALYMRYE